MDIDLLRKEFHEYAERMAEIKNLSLPGICKMDSADDYSSRLQNNFKEIGRLAAVNREMLDNDLYPLLESAGELDDSIAEELDSLADLLLTVAGDKYDFENLDLPITSLITKRLYEDAERKNDICLRIKRMDVELDVCYSMMNMTERITTHPQISDVYKKRGISIGEMFHSFLKKDIFTSIPDKECRELVLTNSRFMTAFYEHNYNNPEDNERNIEILDRLIDIEKDYFYHEAVPDFDWKYFKFRTLEVYPLSTDINNARGFDEKQIEHICEKAIELKDLINSEPDYYGNIPGSKFINVSLARCRFLANIMSLEDYKALLLEEYNKRDKLDFGVDGGYFNVLIPLEYICLIDKNNFSAYDTNLLKDFYQSLCAYAFHIPNNGAMSFILEYFSAIIDRFIEIPSGIGLEEFVIRFLAAMHPPTYVHSIMVGQLSERLCYHLIKYAPKRFIGIDGYINEEDVASHAEDILKYVYHAALLHDAGKIFIIDTIFVYGRKLLDFEFELIKSHPVMGYNLLKKHRSTCDYADIALFHHKWYDDSKGYPIDKNSAESKYKTIIDIVQCADCLDAATDTVGRSYSRGKTLEQFMEELKEGGGTRYAPWLYELFEHEDVFKDIEYLLDNSRKRNYKETYNLLRDVQGRNV